MESEIPFSVYRFHESQGKIKVKGPLAGTENGKLPKRGLFRLSSLFQKSWNLAGSVLLASSLRWSARLSFRVSGRGLRVNVKTVLISRPFYNKD